MPDNLEMKLVKGTFQYEHAMVLEMVQSRYGHNHSKTEKFC